MQQKIVKLLLDTDIVAWLSCPGGRSFDERVNKILRLVMEFECRRQSRIASESDLDDLKSFWEELGDWEDLYLAERELGGIRAGRIKTTPLEDVIKRLDE